MPRVPAHLILPWWNHLRDSDQDPLALLSGTGVQLRELEREHATVEWAEFAMILGRFSWITGEQGLASAHLAAWEAQPWWHRPWSSAGTAEDLAGRLRTLFRVEADPALSCHIIVADWDRIVVQVELADGCKREPLVFDFLETLFRVFPSSQGLPLLRLSCVRGSRGATFAMLLEPRRARRWWRSIVGSLRLVVQGDRWQEKIRTQQNELQDSLNETLQAHSRTRTLNLVGLDLAECTDLAELADALARSLNAHLLATGLTLHVDSVDSKNLAPILISRGLPGPHRQVAELRTAQRRVGEVRVWMESEAIHQDLLEELAPWIAISVQNALAIQTIRDQSEQLALEFEQARLAAAAQRELERQLLRTQKLESLGVMARGVAHDFNNLLVGVLSNAQMASQSLPSEDDSQAHLKRIIHTAQQATQLTEQMLTYSGHGGSEIDCINLSDVVSEIGDMLQASMPKKVRFELQLAENLPTVDIDRSQLQQVVLNLVRNGAEAIGDRRGTVVLRTDLVLPQDSLEDSEVFTNRLPRGDAVLLEVSDTGQGIETRSRNRVFDPFYSTRGPGRGMGLSSVLGIVRSHQGALSMRSQPGKGSVFQVLLPRSIQAASQSIISAKTPWRGYGTILIVDDEEVVREALREMLELQGFIAWVAVDGDQAMSTFESARERLRAVILDWNMPGLNGIEVFEGIRALDTNIPVILTSAYKPDEHILSLKGGHNLSFLRKPFTMEALRAALEQGLNRSQTA